MGRKRRRGESNNWGRMDKNWWITNYVYAVISGLCVRSHNKICFFFNLLLFLYMITYFLSIPHIKIFFLLLCTIMTKSLWLLKSDLYLTLDSKLEFYLHFAHFINNKKATYWSIDSWDWKTLLKTCPPGRNSLLLPEWLGVRMRFRVANNMKDMDRRMIRDVVGEQGVSESHIATK